MPGQVDKEQVKRRLRLEQQAWEAEQLAAGCSEAPTLQIWSVGKLLRVLQASRSAENALEMLAQCGIVRHLVGSVDPRRATSQPTAESPQTAPKADAVTYTSSRVWLTGFLHFGEDVDACDTLHLCDNNAKLPSFLLDPSPQLVDQLVLVKRWVLVDKAFGGVRTAGSMFLEVHDEKPVSLMPVEGDFVDWPREKVMEVLEASYETKDPPMYTGTEPWAAVAARSSGSGVGNGISVFTTAEGCDGLEQPRKSKKRKRVHCVFGRVASVSPISRQRDRDSSHFFVEIEQHQSCNDSTTQSAVTVMFTGVRSMRWHLFLCPGKIVLLTDLVKVLSRECEMFLLQATNGHQSGDPLESLKGSLKTSGLVWQGPASPQRHLAQWINDSLHRYSKTFASLCCGKLFDYEGQVSRLLWDECIELLGSDGTQVIVCLFHFPYTHELVRIRKGATIRVCGAHVLRWPTPVGGKLVIGLCPRSYFVVTAFSDPSSSCIAVGTRSRRNRAHKKWSSLGDFHSQSMVLSMWLLEVLELLDSKFFFGEDEKILLFGSSLLSFSRIRRRQAVSHVAKKLGLKFDFGRDQKTATLGTLFLKCHTHNANSCPTIQLPCEKLLTCNRVVTIRELQAFGECKVKELFKMRAGDSSTINCPVSIQIPAESLDWCLLFGCIRGNVDSGDLEAYDRTGSISLHLSGNMVSTDFDGERGVYLIRTFNLTIEDYNQSQDVDSLPLICCVSCPAANIEYIPMHDGDGISFSPDDKTQTETQELLIMVTHVDALPRSDIRRAGLLPEYRTVHGILFPIAQDFRSDLFMMSAVVADFLINTRCINWYLQKGGCYRIKAIEDSQNIENRSLSHYSKEDQAIKASVDYLEATSFAGGNSVICFDTLPNFCGASSGEPNREERPFRVYRVENGRDSIVPIIIKCGDFTQARCEKHNNCKSSEQNLSGILVPPNGDSVHGNLAALFTKEQQFVNQTPIEVSVSELVAISAFRYFIELLEGVSQVSDLLHHPLSHQPQGSVEDDDEEQPIVMTVDPSLHKAHLISIIGKITTKKYFWQASSTQQSSNGTVGTKRAREVDNEEGAACGSSQRLLCILHVRDLQHLDTVEIRVDASRFGLLATLQVNRVIEFTRLQGFIARSSYKVYLKWSHLTAARPIPDDARLPIPSDAMLYGSMTTTFLNDLYHSSYVDRRLHRYVVGVMHISYVLMKRKCGSCHQALQLIKRRGCWKHAEPQPGVAFYRECKWRQQHWAISDPAFKTRTYLGTTVRCVIDDGSAQAELFLENDVAWELLTCPAGQRRRFEDILSHYVDDLSYFSGRTATGSIATSRAEREREYYQNELRAFVVGAIPALRSVAVFARRFYKAKQRREGTSVLTFGKDIHLTTQTAPQPKLEARRVDRLHVRSELRRRLAQLRRSGPD